MENTDIRVLFYDGEELTVEKISSDSEEYGPCKVTFSIDAKGVYIYSMTNMSKDDFSLIVEYLDYLGLPHTNGKLM